METALHLNRANFSSKEIDRHRTWFGGDAPLESRDADFVVVVQTLAPELQGQLTSTVMHKMLGLSESLRSGILQSMRGFFEAIQEYAPTVFQVAATNGLKNKFGQAVVAGAAEVEAQLAGDEGAARRGRYDAAMSVERAAQELRQQIHVLLVLLFQREHVVEDQIQQNRERAAHIAQIGASTPEARVVTEATHTIVVEDDRALIEEKQSLAQTINKLYSRLTGVARTVGEYVLTAGRETGVVRATQALAIPVTASAA